MQAVKPILITGLVLLGATCPMTVQACPFCSAVSQTLSQEIEAADIAVVAKLITLPAEADLDSGDPVGLDLDDPDSGTAEFEVIEVLRGDDLPEGAPAVGATIKVVYFGGNEDKDRFLINGIAGKRVDWTTPMPLTERGIDYIKALGNLPEKGADRLAFFLNHLEDEDPLLAQDAYDEFGRAPYEEVIAVGDRMDRQQLIEWIEDSRVGPTRRRLYLTMLGICGQPEDVAILESLINYDYQQLKPGIAATMAVMGQTGPVIGVPILNEMIRADVRRKQQCLDALIAAYLKLKGPAGLPLIEEQFLKNPAAEYTHVYAAVMALRFHGEETDSLPRARLLQSMRLLLDNADIADQVIPDLARWDDWTVLDRLVTMFKESEADAWVRQPVISYLLAATDQPEDVGQRADAALADLEELDPEGVKRARSYMAFGLLSKVGKKKKPSAQSAEAQSAETQSTEIQSAENKSDDTITAAQSKDDQSNEQAKSAETLDASVDASAPPGPSRVMIIGGPLVAGIFLFGVFALLLRGADVRSSSSDS